MAAYSMDLLKGPPIVWAHCGTENALGVMNELRSRLECLDDGVQFKTTVISDIGQDVGDSTCLDSSDALQNYIYKVKPCVALFVGVLPSVRVINFCTRFSIPIIFVDCDAHFFQKRFWLWRKLFLKRALKRVRRLFVANTTTASVWKSLGIRAECVEIGPPIQQAVAALRCDETERGLMSTAISARPVWFLNSVPVEEFNWALEAIQTAQRSWPRLVTLFDARNLDDIPAFKAALIEAGLIVHDRAVEGEPDALTQVFITDGPDEAALWYRLASLSYLGGTLSGQESANPLDAAALGCGLLHGANIVQHHGILDLLMQAGATTCIQHGSELGDAVCVQLAPDICAQKVSAAWGTIYAGAETTDRLMQYICQTLGLEETD